MGEELLEKWEANYKKGLLSFWILLSLSQRPMYAYEMREQIEGLSKGSIEADDNSIYRALRRFAKNGLIVSEMHPSDQGPPRRYFELTREGCELLAAFIRKNIAVFEHNDVRAAMQNILKTN